MCSVELESSWSMNLGGCVIPIWFMTCNWSYFEFSHQIHICNCSSANRDGRNVAQQILHTDRFRFHQRLFSSQQELYIYYIDRIIQNYCVIYWNFPWLNNTKQEIAKNASWFYHHYTLWFSKLFSADKNLTNTAEEFGGKIQSKTNCWSWSKLESCNYLHVPYNIRTLENCLWKSNFGTVWGPGIMSIHKIQ